MVEQRNTIRPSGNTANKAYTKEELLAQAREHHQRRLQSINQSNSKVSKPNVQKPVKQVQKTVKPVIDKKELERKAKIKLQEEKQRQYEAKIREQERLRIEEEKRKYQARKEAELKKKQKAKEKALQKEAYKVVKAKQSKYAKKNSLAKKGVNKLKVRKTIGALLTFALLGVGGFTIYKTGLIQTAYSDYQTNKLIEEAKENSNPLADPIVIPGTTESGEIVSQEEVAEEVTEEKVTEEEVVEEVVEEKHEVINTDMYDEGYEFNPEITPEFLNSLNPVLSESTAWLEIPGTNINYAFVHPSTANVDQVDGLQAEIEKSGKAAWEYMSGYFLHKDMTLHNSSKGTLFLDLFNKPLTSHYEDLTDVNTIYGHHMADGSMFKQLMNWKSDKNGTYNEQHPFAIIYTDDGYGYKVTFIASRVVSGEDAAPLHNYNFKSYEEKCEFVQNMIDEAHENGWFALDSYEVQPDDKFMNLVTCTYEYNNARFQLFGVMQRIKVRDTNLTDDENGYYVEENSNSNTINR